MKIFKVNVNPYCVVLFCCLLMASCTMKSQNEKKAHYKSYISYHAIDPIVINGKGDEESWKKTEWSTNFIDIEGIEKPLHRTRMKMLWDDTYLYIYAELEEDHIWGDITKRDEVIFYNNDFEVFIDATGDTHNYYEFEMNALNTVWDLFLTKPYRNNGTVLNNWDINGLKSAVDIEGTINDASDIDKKWSVEIAMPWSVLNEASSSKEVPKGKTWRINFSRVNWNFDIVDGKYQRKKDKSTGKYLPEYNWVWSSQGVINMHEPEKWGYVLFSEKNAGEKDNFTIPNDEKVKWEMYNLYRAQNEYFKNNNKWSTSVQSLSKGTIIVENKELDPSLEFNDTGWNLKVISPFSNKTLIIKDDGKFITK